MKTLLQKTVLLGLILLWGLFFVFDYHVSTNVNQADRLLAARQPDAADALYVQAEQAEPWRKLDWIELARVYLMLGKPDKAVNILETQAEKDRLKSTGWLILAQAYEKTSRVEQVESALQNADIFAETPDEKSEALTALVQYYRAQTRFEDALTYQKQISSPQISSAESRINEVLLLTVIDPDAGLSEWVKFSNKPAWFDSLGKAVKKALSETDDSRRWVQIGRAYAAAGVWDLAENSFTRATQRSPDYPEAWGLLAEARQQQEKDGRVQIEKALELAPQSPAVRLLGALFYRRQFDFKKAIALLQQNIDDQPGEVLWFLEMGRTLADAGRLEEAILAYQQAVQLKPEDPVPYQNLAHFCMQFAYRLEDEGLPAARQAVTLAPDSEEAFDILGQVYFTMGDVTKAEESYKTALEINPEFAPTWLHLGQMALSEQNYGEAKEAFQKAVTPDSNTTEGILAARLLKQYFQITVDQTGK